MERDRNKLTGIGCAPGLFLQRLEPGGLIHPSGQLLKVSDDQRAHRGVTLRGSDPGIAVEVIGKQRP